MSRAHPWAPTIARAMQQAMPVQRAQVMGAVEDDYHNQDDPRLTGRLLSSLSAAPGAPWDATFFVRGPSTEQTPNSPAFYGALLNRGTGGDVILPTGGRQAMSWIQPFANQWGAAGARIFRKEVKGSNAHVGWWDTWRHVGARIAVGRGWKNRAR